MSWPVLHITVLVGLGLALAMLAATPARAAGFIQSDICVYGGTSGGVAAAVAAARLGKNVSLVTVNNHVGGMTSGGLSVTDIGSFPASIGGIAAEFYARVGTNYGIVAPVYNFEPHVAEQTFRQMLSQAGVAVYTNEQLAAVTLSNLVITQITMADGTVYRAKEFIDTTYEGDLMAMAGVSFTVGRESAATYGESLAGAVVNSVQYPCDPYVIAGNASSGLLPFIQPGTPETTGTGDSKVQCYNFRLCLSQNPTNMLPITAPPNYAATNYELTHRYITAYLAVSNTISLNNLINVQKLLPNGKADINSSADISTDYIGYNYTYPTNNYAARQLIYQQHSNYIAGLLYYLGNSTNVPANVRSSMLSWGYAKDEFSDNGGWPGQLYVREARRMVSDYIMEEGDALGGRFATDSIALANYTLDSHPVARYAYNGMSVTEGDIGVPLPAPYPISYRSIIPAAGQCQNLFCTFALSASHVGFASIRLEPVFMMTSQSAGTAAAFAIDDQVPVQSVNYQKLAAELLADGQILAWNNAPAIATNGIILTVTNTTGVTVSSGWAVGSNTGGWPLPSGPYLNDGNTNKGTSYVAFNPNIATNGYYDVYAWWVFANNRANNTPVDIVSATSTNRVYLNQQIACTNWFKIAASNYFTTGTNGSVTVRNVGTTGYVIANAFRWAPSVSTTNSASLPVMEIVASDAVAGEFDTNTGRFTVVCPNGTNDVPETVYYTVGGTAQSGVDYAALPGGVTLPAGAIAARIMVTPLGGNLAQNQETITLTLSAGTNYLLNNLASATVNLQDWPYNVWKRASFTASQLANPAVSGDTATPANDGLANLMKYALGLSPLTPYANVFQPAVSNGLFTITYAQSESAPDVALTFSWSPDLIHWYSGPGYLQTASLLNQVTNQLITLQAMPPALTNGFVKAQATRLSP